MDWGWYKRLSSYKHKHRNFRWKELTEQFEKKSSSNLPDLSLSFPERLEYASSRINYYDFRQLIRESILKKTSEAIIYHARNSEGEPPNCIRCLAKLGSLANPIINFNVEN